MEFKSVGFEDPWEAVLKSIEGRNFPSVNLHLSLKIEFWRTAAITSPTEISFQVKKKIPSCSSMEVFLPIV